MSGAARPEVAGERITHPHAFCTHRFGWRSRRRLEQRSLLASNAARLLLLRLADVSDDHFDLVRRHALVGECVHGFLVFAAIGNYVG
jgi:hypothetical protein